VGIGHVEGIEQIGGQQVGGTLQRVDVGLACIARHRVAQPAAGAVDHDAPEPIEAVNQVQPARPGNRASVNQ
jgi:hypothetical protein